MNFNDIKFTVAKNNIEDFQMLRKIHTISMKEKVTEYIGEWDEDFQFDRLRKRFNQAGDTLQFIVYEGEIIGTINVRNQDFEDGIYPLLEQFYLLPQFQGKGLGKYLLNLKLPKSEVRLTVLRKDIQTQQFYMKNGFIEYGEDEYLKYMKKLTK